MSLVRFCSRAFLRNKVNCISPATVARNQLSWLSSSSASSDYRRDYHSSSSSPSSNSSGRKFNDGEKRRLLEQIFFGQQQQQQRTLSAQSPPGTIGQRDPLNTSFADPNAAFKSKTLIELIRAYVVYMICSSGYLVENNMKVRMLWNMT